MAIYHLSAKPISRAQGRSATGAAAYRAGVAITDERTGLVHDYSRKRGVLHSELILPGGATADRAAFWNRIEAHHKRGDAVLVREIEISLPTELSVEQRQALAVGYARELADRYGVAADLAVHAPRTVTDRDLEKTPNQRWEIDPDTGRRHNGNWHAHIMLSACHVAPDGTLGKKAVELDPIHCQRAKIGNMADRERARWADLANTALERHGHEARIDHRSHAARGIEAEPTPHLGPAASGYERRMGKPSRKRQDFEQEVAERLARAAKLERQAAELDRSIIDTSGDLAAALAEEQERQCIGRMTAAELRAAIERLRPPPVCELVDRDPAVVQAERLRDDLARRHTAAEKAAEEARKAAAAWRERHKVQSWFHAREIGHAPALRELEQQRDRASAECASLAPRIEPAILEVLGARDAAQLRITLEQAPIRAKLAELEGLRQEKVRQELEQERRQRAEQAAQREREAAPKDFAVMALKRELRMVGWGDTGGQWQAAPEGLRTLIERYNSTPQDERPAALQRLFSNPETAEQTRGLMDGQQGRDLGRGRGR